MHLVADDHADARGAEDALLVDVPARAGEQGVASGDDAGEVGEGRARGERGDGALRHAEQVQDPAGGDLVERGGGGGGDREAGVLVPRGREDRRSGSGRLDPAVDEAEEAPVVLDHGGGGAERVELREHLAGRDGRVLEGTPEHVEAGDRVRGRSDGPVGSVGDVAARAAGSFGGDGDALANASDAGGVGVNPVQVLRCCAHAWSLLPTGPQHLGPDSQATGTCSRVPVCDEMAP